jgi:hypothetical protein
VTPCSQIDPSGVTGICVIGDVTPNGSGPPTVHKAVNGVTIFGITVKGFSANGILGFSTKKLTISHTRLQGEQSERGIRRNPRDDVAGSPDRAQERHCQEEPSVGQQPVRSVLGHDRVG